MSWHKTSLIATTLLGTLLFAATALAASHKSALEYQAIARDFRITSEVKADFDSDLVDEVAIAYRTKGSVTPEGGLMVLKPVGGAYRPVFHVFFDSTYASELRGSKGVLELVLVRTGPAGDEKAELTWRYGELFVFVDHERSFARGIRATASSRAKGTTASNVIDNDLETAWAEGVAGTGVGESVTVKLSKPVGVGLVGIMTGRSTDRRRFKRANRVHRATLEIQTESDVGDEASALDFSDLGIDIGGDSEEVSFPNEPAFKFFRIKRSKALNLVLKIDSVYLGDKDDDTYVAEIQVVPLVPRTITLDRAQRPKSDAKTPSVSGTVIEGG